MLRLKLSSRNFLKFCLKFSSKFSKKAINMSSKMKASRELCICKISDRKYGRTSICADKKLRLIAKGNSLRTKVMAFFIPFMYVSLKSHKKLLETII